MHKSSSLPDQIFCFNPWCFHTTSTNTGTCYEYSPGNVRQYYQGKVTHDPQVTTQPELNPVSVKGVTAIDIA